MTIDEIIGSSAISALVGGIVYAVNKWLIPTYNGLKKEIEDLRIKLEKEVEIRIELESQLSYLKGKYAEKTILKSGKFKNKRNNEI